MSCYLCEKRVIGCHATCSEYAETAERSKLIREERRKASLFNGVTAKKDKDHDKAFIKSAREV